MSTFPATNSNEAVELIIDGGNQLHQIINEDATAEIQTESGPIPSVRKALADTFLFLEPVPWQQGSDEISFNQLRSFGSNTYWAPTATLANPIPMGATPDGDDNWKLAPVNTSLETINQSISDNNTSERSVITDYKVYSGSNGSYVQVGDTIPSGTNSLAVLVSGEVRIFKMSPQRSGTIDSLILPNITINGGQSELTSWVTGNFNYISDVDGNVHLGQLISVEDYAQGNNSGRLYFKVVPSATGVADGGKFIDLPLSGLQLRQNIKRPYSCKSWGAKSDAINPADNDLPLQKWLDYRGKLYAPQGNYNHVKPLKIHSGTILVGDGVVLDSSITLPDGSSVQSSDLVTTFTKHGNDSTGGADSSFIFGDSSSVKYITLMDFQLDSTNNTEFGFWRGLEGNNLEASSLTYSNIVVRNHRKGSWLEKAYLVYYKRFVMGGGEIGLYCGYNNSTSNHATDCYMNLVDTGYWFNSVYSSINNCASDKANIAYRMGNSVELNNCGCEFPNTALLAEYTSDPIVVNKMKIIAKDEGTTVVVNYDGTRCASVTFNNSSISATDTAKQNLTISNIKGVDGKPRFVQFVNTYVDTYNSGTDNTERFPLWDYGFVRNATDRNVTVIYGTNQRQKFITEALGSALFPTKKFVLLKLSRDADYDIVFNKPFGDNQGAYLPNGRLASVKFIINGEYVALQDFSKFHSAQDIKFFTKTGEDKSVYLQYEQQNDVGNDVTVTLTGGMADNVYNLQQVENPSSFTEITPYQPL